MSLRNGGVVVSKFHLFVFGVISVLFSWCYADLNPDGYCVICYSHFNNVSVSEAMDIIRWFYFTDNFIVILSLVVGVVCMYLAMFFLILDNLGCSV